MPRTCTICAHNDRSEIDAALLNGEPYRRIAQRYAASPDAVNRHKREHLSSQMAQAARANGAADVRTAIDVVQQLRAINDEAHAVLIDARESRDGELRLKAIEQVRKQIELQARLIDLIRDGDTVNITISPQWLEIRAVVIDALSGHPDASQRVAEALQSIEEGGTS